jgi:hypothetical protein
MARTSRDRISVDLRGLRAALFEQARTRGISPSDLVRAALATALDQAEPSITGRSAPGTAESSTGRVRLSLRMSRSDALATIRAARVAGLAPGAYVAGLIAGIPVLTSGSTRADHLASLIASSAELSTLCRNLHRLTSLLRQGSVRAAQEYRDMLDTVADDVREHLTLASSVLADLRPRHGRAPAAPDQHA